MHKLLEAKARKAKSIDEKVKKARLSENTSSMILYLFWRNRFPILTRITSRFLLFAELYLLYMLFSSAAIASLSIVIFLMFMAKGSFQGISQFFRLKIVDLQQQKKLGEIGKLHHCLQIFSNTYGILVGLLSIIVAFSLTSSWIARIFTIIWAILLPMQLRSSSAWMTVYTKHRLKRSFVFILFCRLIPLFSIISFSGILKVYSYPLGLLIGRGLEYLYLEKTATKCLQLNKILLLQKIPNDFVLNCLKQRKLWKLWFSSASYFIFQSVLGIAIYLQSSEMWFTHFSLFFVITTFSYIPLRIPYSLSFDLYEGLKTGNIIRCNSLIKNIRKFQFFVSLIFSAFCILLLYLNTAIFTVAGSIIYFLFIYFISLLVMRTWYLSEYSIIRTAGLEVYNYVICSSLLLISVAFFEVFILKQYRANLPMIYLVECITFIGLSLFLTLKLNPKLSEIYIRALNLRREGPKLLLPWVWFEEIKKQHKKLGFLIIQFDARYSLTDRTDTLLRVIGKNFNNDILYTEIAPSLVVGTIDKDFADKYLEIFRSELAGHVRNAIIVDQSQYFFKTIDLLLFNFKKVRQLPKSLSAYSNILNSIKTDKLFDQTGELSSDLRNSKNLGEIASHLDTWLTNYVGKKIPKVTFDGHRINSEKLVSLECLQAAHKYCLAEGSTKRLLPLLQSPIAFVNWIATPLIVYDLKGFSDVEIKKVYQSSLMFFLLSIEIGFCHKTIN